jgi:Flp pilus assembly protein TadG
MCATTRDRIRGQVLVITGLVLMVLLGVAGLAIDSGFGYIVRARLNSALDAAAFAGARAIVIGNTQGEQEASAAKAANDFFAANYPSGLWGSTPTLDPLKIDWNVPTVGAVTVNVSGTSVVPVNIMGLFGFDVLTVKSLAAVVRKDVDLAFVMDTTDSMAPVAANVKSSAKSFLDHFSKSTDRIALIHFAHGAVVDVPFKADQSRGFDRDSMKGKIDAFSFNGFTNYAEGFWNARDQLNNHISMAKRSSLRVIVFFSDGAPNTFASYFTFKSTPSCVALGVTSVSGALQTAAASSGTPDGLWQFDAQSQALAGTCYRGTSIVGCSSGPCLAAAALPAWYNAHSAADTEFAVVTATPRPVTNSTASQAIAYQNVNRASRNLAESMAAKSRDEGIYVFTLGLGSHVKDLTGPDNEDGESLLKCMANTPDSLPRCYNKDKPIGVYCWAATDENLRSCYDVLASQIMTLAK